MQRTRRSDRRVQRARAADGELERPGVPADSALWTGGRGHASASFQSNAREEARLGLREARPGNRVTRARGGTGFGARVSLRHVHTQGPAWVLRYPGYSVGSNGTKYAVHSGVLRVGCWYSGYLREHLLQTQRHVARVVCVVHAMAASACARACVCACA